METQVRTPQTIFMQAQRLIVPLFQRPYVWNEENQWEPLWSDVARVAERLLQAPSGRPQPHFLGAVVLQQVQNPVGTMQERTIIDGQQRLTTLQLLFDALQAELMAVGAQGPALRLETLVKNADPFCRSPDDRFKVLPTNRDRPAFNAVMAAQPPVDYGAVGHAGQRMVEAHRYFAEQAREWLTSGGNEDVVRRSQAIETAAREYLQVVVIDLGADENAQEIFETLNARGAQLTAADLIKNFVFQRLSEAGGDVENAYRLHWQEFESAFWEDEVSVGRLRYPRSSIFLNHWLIARTGEEVIAREVFTRFKRYALEVGTEMEVLLEQIHRAAETYRRFIEAGKSSTGPVDRLGLFAYRTSVLESEVVKPLVLWLLDAEQPTIPTDQLAKAMDAVESWMVRRMLVRAATKSYTQLFAELITRLKACPRAVAGDEVEQFLKAQESGSRYWPDDDELREELRVLPAYRRLGRGRLRMVLEAIEDFRRGWTGGKTGLGGERVARRKYAIEHVMPRKWETHWPLAGLEDVERNALIHTLGNLTLLTGKLNAKVSNGPWQGETTGKRHALEGHDVLLLNRELLKRGREVWNESLIRERSGELASCIIEIWPAPAGHRSGFQKERVRPRHKVDLSDLISAGCVHAGMQLFPRSKKHAEHVATLLPDGRLDVNGTIHASPSDAASAIRGRRSSGWHFFLVDRQTRRSLRNVRLEYLESMAADIDEDDDTDLDDDG